jgi:peptidoglycan/xylan/chitin deacetylase (PgdA/CDA1 family)
MRTNLQESAARPDRRQLGVGGLAEKHAPGMHVRKLAKAWTDWCLDSLLLPIHRKVVRSPSVILAYHNIVPDDWMAEGDVSLHLRRAHFSIQLDALLATHDVVPLASILASPQSSSARPRAAITFDDAYAGALSLGVAELVRRELPATVFVAPGWLGGKTFWWDDFADGAHGVRSSLRKFALNKLAGDDREIRAWAERRAYRRQETAPVLRGCQMKDLAKAVATGFITLAAHSWTHPLLPTVDRERLVRELVDPLNWLRREFGQAASPYLAYPYGGYDDSVVLAAQRAGYVAAFTVAGGPVRTPIVDGWHELPRVNVPAGISLSGFIRRSAGMPL